MKVKRTVARPPETFGERVKRLRLERGWTQEDLAFEAGISQMAVSFYESGRYEPKSSTLEALAAVLDTRMDALWLGEAS